MHVGTFMRAAQLILLPTSVAVVLLLVAGGCDDGRERTPANRETLSDDAERVVAAAQPDSRSAPKPPAPSYEWPHDKPWFGDLDGMIERRLIRALVVYNDLFYFLEGPRQRGMTYDYLEQLERYLNSHLENGALPVQVLCIAVGRDQLIPWLLEGKGDIAAAAMSVTRERRRLVDFSAPFASNVRQILVTGPTAPAIGDIDDLSGRKLLVHFSSSYREHLEHVNRDLSERGLLPIALEPAPRSFEDADLLKMVDAGILPYAVTESRKAAIWSQLLQHIEIREDLTIHRGGQIAWAFRKKSPELKALLDVFAAEHRQGTLHGNIFFNRYLKDSRRLRKPRGWNAQQGFDDIMHFLKGYARMYGFDWALLAALAYQESGWDQATVGPQGAIGIMQVLPSTARDPNVNIPHVERLEDNIHAGTKYLRFIYDRYFSHQSMDDTNKMLFTIAAYNAGPARIAALRERAAEEGLDPDIWFNSVETIAAKRIGPVPGQYLRNIYSYYLAYRLVMAKQAVRQSVQPAP